MQNCCSEGQFGVPRSNLLIKGAIILFGARKLLLRRRKRLFWIAIYYLKGRKLLPRVRKRLLKEAIILFRTRKLLPRARKRLLKGAIWGSIQ